MSICANLLRQFDPENVVELSDSVWQKLAAYPWPGNIRQLKNTMQFIVYSRGEGLATDADLPEDLLQPIANATSPMSLAAYAEHTSSIADSHHHEASQLARTLSRRDELLGALHQTRWCVAKAAPPCWC